MGNLAGGTDKKAVLSESSRKKYKEICWHGSRKQNKKQIWQEIDQKILAKDNGLNYPEVKKCKQNRTFKNNKDNSTNK